MTDPAALLTRLEQAKQSRDVWQIGLAEQALEHAAPELAARVLQLEAENKRLREAIADARLIAVDAQLRATYQKTALERISDLLRTALKGGK